MHGVVCLAFPYTLLVLYFFSVWASFVPLPSDNKDELLEKTLVTCLKTWRHRDVETNSALLALYDGNWSPVDFPKMDLYKVTSDVFCVVL